MRSINFKSIFLLIGGSLFFYSAANAQSSDELYIFGFSQTLFNSKHLSLELHPYPTENPTNGLPVEYSNTYKTNTFALHQLNLFFRKSVSEKTTFFLNLEATGSYSSKTKSGDLQIPEGWISHRFSPRLQVKVGLLVPRFNNLNEIRNRLPLFPYVIRPSIYEDLFNGTFNQEDYIPRHAYLQLTGKIPVNETLVFDYSAFVGNSETSYGSTVDLDEASMDELSSSSLYKGENQTTLLSVGGRIGIKSLKETFKLGISGTFDHDNRNEVSYGALTRFPGITLPAFGDLPRYRLGIDFSFTYKKFDFESEFIGVYHDHSTIRKIVQYQDFNLNKHFYYGLLTYNLTEKYYFFGGYNQFSDRSFEALIPESPDASGLHNFSFGSGIRFVDGVVMKGQYTKILVGENPHMDVEMTFFTLGVSVLF